MKLEANALPKPISARRLSASSPKIALATALTIAAAIYALDNAAGQSYPTRPIKVIMPFGVGSPPDTLGRAIGQDLSNRLGQSVIIENRPGAGSTIATKAAAMAAPDGYTLLQVNSALAYAEVLYPNPGYDPLTSFSPVAALATWSLLLVVNADIPVNTVQELIAYSKAHPGQVNIGHTLGSPPQVLAEMFKKASGAPFNSVPYRQVSQLTSDLLSGRIHAFFGGGAGLVALVQQGKLKALAYTGVTRYAGLPLVPTVIESGFPLLAFNPTDWTGIVAPAGTPSAVIDTLNAAIKVGLNSPEIRTSILQQGADAKITSPLEFATFLAAEVRKWPARVRESGLKPD